MGLPVHVYYTKAREGRYSKQTSPDGDDITRGCTSSACAVVSLTIASEAGESRRIGGTYGCAATACAVYMLVPTRNLRPPNAATDTPTQRASTVSHAYRCVYTGALVQARVQMCILHPGIMCNARALLM